MPIFRRQTGTSCFFCQSTINPRPRDPSSYRCPYCGCWNRYDANGQIISDEPAMHDEALNSRSFAKRASPSKDRLPTIYSKGPFCHQCQTNQMLLVNLLSNYLPSTDSPEYNYRVERLPQYKESLRLRYPPVCASCRPSVEEEIRKKDDVVRTKALGGWLEESKGKGKQRQVSVPPGREMEKLGMKNLAWKVRGCLWVMSLTSTVLGYSIAALGYRLPSLLTLPQPILPGIALVSILWTVWDPTYSVYQKSQLQGRDVRVRGKNLYIIVQMVAWFSRVATSILITLPQFRPHADYLHLSDIPLSSRSHTYFSALLTLELLTSIASCIVLRLHQPPSIRLIDTTTHLLSSDLATPSIPQNGASRPNQPLSEPDLLSTLSLSSKPILTTSNPIFGLPSLLSVVPPSLPAPSKDEDCMDEDADADAMDWTPTTPSSPNKGKQRVSPANDDGSWIRPQRFFAPEAPTGLEGLFERTQLVDDSDRFENHSGRVYLAVGAHVVTWWWVYLLSLVPLVGIAYKAREGRDRPIGIVAPAISDSIYAQHP